MKNRPTTTIKLTALILLSIAATIAAEDPPNPCSNPYTAMLKADTDPVIQAVALDTATTYTVAGGICATEWMEHKTCCDHTKVIAAGEKRLNAWKEDINSFVKKARGFAESLNARAAEISMEVSTFKTDFATFKVNVAVTAKVSAEGLSEIEDLVKYVEKKTPFDRFKPEIFNPAFDKFKAGFPKCFDEIKKFRLGAVCGLCSARASSFFSENSKVKISQDQCLKITKACAHSWDFMFKTIQAMKTVVQLDKIKKYATHTGAKIDPENKKVIDREAIHEALNTLSFMDPENFTFEGNVELVCQNLLSFNKPNAEVEKPQVDRLDTAITIESNNKAAFEAKTPDQKAEITAKLITFAAQREVMKAQMETEFATKMLALNAVITSKSAALETKKGELQMKQQSLDQKREQLKAAGISPQEKTNLMSQIQTLNQEISVKLGEMKDERDGIALKIKDASKSCQTNCQELLTKVNLFNEAEKSRVAEIRKAEAAQKAQAVEQEEKLKIIMAEIKTINTQIETLKQQTATKLEGFVSKTDLQKEAIRGEVTEILNNIATKKTEAGALIEKVTSAQAFVQKLNPDLAARTFDFKKNIEAENTKLQSLEGSQPPAPPKLNRILSANAADEEGCVIDTDANINSVVNEREAPSSQLNIEITESGSAVIRSVLFAIAVCVINILF